MKEKKCYMCKTTDYLTVGYWGKMICRKCIKTEEQKIKDDWEKSKKKRKKK